MPQNEHIEQHIRRHGRRLNYLEKKRKKEGRAAHDRSKKAKKMIGLKAKLYNKERRKEKIEMKKKILMHEKRDTKVDRLFSTFLKFNLFLAKSRRDSRRRYASLSSWSWESAESESSFEHGQAEAQGESWQMGCSPSQRWDLSKRISTFFLVESFYSFFQFERRLKPKSSKWWHRANERRKHGNEWLPKSASFQRISPERTQNMNDSFARWRCVSRKRMSPIQSSRYQNQ